jgi:diguanylate cyclase (GGDEF)-like protein
VLELTHEHIVGRRPVGVVWLEVSLEGVNAAMGHATGDELLVLLALRLRAIAGAHGVGRVGGSEFVVVLGLGPDQPGVADVVAAVLAAVDQPFQLAGVEVLARAAVGVTVEAATAEGDTAADLLRRADIAMQHARRTGRQVEHYTPELESTDPARLALAADLQSGIARDELVLYAQPQLRVSDGAVTGVEMLVRWQHPRLGMLSPGEFIPLAEQTGLDRPMTAWVIDRSLRSLAAWRAAGLQLNVSVNVSAGALCDGHLPAQVEEMLLQHRVPGGELVVEVTESAVLTSTNRAAHALSALSDLGVRISVDDFGTGFSSLSHLRSLPVDEIKVDQSFIKTMLEVADDAAIVQSVIILGHGLGLDVVAEGIETEQVYEALRDLGCDAAQGYHLARPMPVEEIEAWLASAPAAVSGGLESST